MYNIAYCCCQLGNLLTFVIIVAIVRLVKLMGKEQDPLLPNREIDLSSKVAVVTGASRGIGRAIAIELGRSGAHVVVNSRSDASEVLSKIESFGSKSVWVPGDILEKKTRELILKETVDNFGRLDILINNVGARHDGLFIRTTNEDMQRVFDVNFFSAAFLTREGIAQMVKQRPQGGKIVFIGSLAAEGSPGQAIYSASKAALVGFAKALAREYQSRNIQVNVISPGLVETDMVKDLNPKQIQALLELTKMERPLKPEEVATPVLRLLSEKSVDTGQVFNITGNKNE